MFEFILNRLVVKLGQLPKTFKLHKNRLQHWMQRLSRSEGNAMPYSNNAKWVKYMSIFIIVLSCIFSVWQHEERNVPGFYPSNLYSSIPATSIVVFKICILPPPPIFPFSYVIDIQASPSISVFSEELYFHPMLFSQCWFGCQFHALLSICKEWVTGTVYKNIFSPDGLVCIKHVPCAQKYMSD